MKVGDSVPVNIGAGTVAQAKVTEVDASNNTVTLVVPATKVVMGLRVELETTPPPAPEPEGASVVITGVDRVDASGNVIDSTNTTGESAAVGATTENASATETPVGTATQTEVVAPTPPVESSTTPSASAAQEAVPEPVAAPEKADD